MNQYNLMINNCSKLFNTKAECEAIVNRAIPYYLAKQKKYTGVQILDYISIDKVLVDKNKNVIDVLIFDVLYIDGSKLSRYNLKK